MLIATSVVVVAVVIVVSRRYAWWRSTVDYKHPRILMYHMVREPRAGARFNKLRVRPEQFEAQVRYLREDGWHFATMAELAGEGSLPDKTVVLTFDDGYEDNLLNADPILARYDAKATLYLVEKRFDRDWSSYKKAHHDSGELKEEPKLSDEQLAQMLASGRWELGAHTRTHANLAAVDDETRKEEIVGGRQALVEQFAAAVDSFAYPFGIYSQADVACARDAGFSTAVTTEEGITTDLKAEALELKRVKVSGKDSLAVFKLRLRTGRRGV